MSYIYDLEAPNGEFLRWESPVMLTKSEAQQQAADLHSCRIGPIAEARDSSNPYAYNVSLANGAEITVRSAYQLTQSEAVDKALELQRCRLLVDESNAEFRLNTVESVEGGGEINASTGGGSSSQGSRESGNAIDFDDPAVVAGWLPAAVFILWMLAKIKRVKTTGLQLTYLLLTFISAALYGLVFSQIFENFSDKYPGGADSAYAQYPSLLFSDLAELTIPLLLGFIAHIGARRLPAPGVDGEVDKNVLGENDE